LVLRSRAIVYPDTCAQESVYYRRDDSDGDNVKRDSLNRNVHSSVTIADICTWRQQQSAIL